jgi:hypothetical protein
LADLGNHELQDLWMPAAAAPTRSGEFKKSSKFKTREPYAPKTYKRGTRLIPQGRADHAARGCLHLKLDRYPRQANGVAQGDEVTGFFGALNACDSGNAQHIAFFGSARRDQRQSRRQHHDLARGNRHTSGAVFVTDIHHVGLALGIKVGQCGGVLAHDRQDRMDLQKVHKKRASYEA